MVWRTGLCAVARKLWVENSLGGTHVAGMFSPKFASRRVWLNALTFTFLLIGAPSFRASAETNSSIGVAPAPVLRWTPTGSRALGNVTPEILGAPRAVDGALEFDGSHDALIFPANPLQGLSRFTVQVLIRPSTDGAAEQRFFHLEDKAGRRVLMELRLDKETRNWSLDTYLHASTETHLALLDRGKKHLAGEWIWATLRYDGNTMSHYVGGVKDGEGMVTFPAMSEGQASLGVRLNRVNWFRGQIREIRIYDRALSPEVIALAAP